MVLSLFNIGGCHLYKDGGPIKAMMFFFIFTAGLSFAANRKIMITSMVFGEIFTFRFVSQRVILKRKIYVCMCI